MVLDNGVLLTMTYNPSQDMIAWTHWDTLGKFTRVAVVRNEASNTEDAIFFVVRRIVNGSVVRFIEQVRSRIFDVPQDCFFMDAGRSLDAPITIIDITGTSPLTIETSVAHNFANGDEVDLSDIIFDAVFDADFNETQPDILNGRRYVIAGVTSTTFQITP